MKETVPNGSSAVESRPDPQATQSGASESQATESTDLQQSIVERLNNPEVQRSMVTALDKLPKFMEQLTQLENTVDFASSVLSDKASLSSLLQGLKSDLPSIEANYETLRAAVALVNKLPKLVGYIETLEPWIEFAAGILSDEASMQHLTTGVGQLVEPIQSTVGEGRDLFAEAKRRAAKDNSQVGVFTLVKLLKDPTLQSSIKVAKSCLEILEERKQVPATS